MKHLFDPRIYKRYNPDTDMEEPQFAEWEDLPIEVRGQFKKAAGGGFVAKDAEEKIAKAYYMALAEKSYRDKVAERKHKYKKRGEAILREAEKQGELAGKAFEAAFKKEGK